MDKMTNELREEALERVNGGDSTPAPTPSIWQDQVRMYGSLPSTAAKRTTTKTEQNNT